MNKKKVFPRLKKDIKDFLLKEEASMIKKDVVKVGMGLLVLSLGLKAGMKADEASAGYGIISNCPRCCPAACSSCVITY